MEAVKLHVWVASHLHSQQRAEWMKEAIESLITQSFVVDVHISLSKEKYVTDELPAAAHVHYVCHEHRKHQFEHLRHLHETIARDHQKTYIMFLDDDDMYHADRTKWVAAYAQNDPSCQVFCDNAYLVPGKATLHNANEHAVARHHDDFANYVVRSDVIDKFFTNNLDTVPHANLLGVLDCVFTSWLKSSYTIARIPEYLYYKRTEPYIRSKTQCWDKPKDFDFEAVKEEYGLTTIFCAMSTIL
jgi:hypothetical protein